MAIINYTDTIGGTVCRVGDLDLMRSAARALASMRPSSSEELLMIAARRNGSPEEMERVLYASGEAVLSGHAGSAFAAAVANAGRVVESDGPVASIREGMKTMLRAAIFVGMPDKQQRALRADAGIEMGDNFIEGDDSVMTSLPLQCAPASDGMGSSILAAGAAALAVYLLFK